MLSGSCHSHVLGWPGWASLSIQASDKPSTLGLPLAPRPSPSFGPGPDCLGQMQACCHLASWRGRGAGHGQLGCPKHRGVCSLRRTISLPAFDLGPGLPASKWCQLLLQATANGQEGAGGGGLESRGVWKREDPGVGTRWSQSSGSPASGWVLGGSDRLPGLHLLPAQDL